MRSSVKEDGAGSPLLSLPRDVVLTVLAKLEPRSVIALGAVARELRELSLSDDLWRLLFASRFQPVIEHAFGGVCPGPLRSTLSFRRHETVIIRSTERYTLNIY